MTTNSIEWINVRTFKIRFKFSACGNVRFTQGSRIKALAEVHCPKTKRSKALAWAKQIKQVVTGMRDVVYYVFCSATTPKNKIVPQAGQRESDYFLRNINKPLVGPLIRCPVPDIPNSDAVRQHTLMYGSRSSVDRRTLSCIIFNAVFKITKWCH